MRTPGRADWDAQPAAPGLVRRVVLSPWAGLVALVFLGLTLRFQRELPTGVVLTAMGVAIFAQLLALLRFFRAARERVARRRLRAALAAMRRQANAEAAVLLEETLRAHPISGGERALALWLFAACASSLGHHARARRVLEPLTASDWRHAGRMRLLRGPGQIVLAVTRALDGDPDAARAARAAYAPTWWHRLVYSPAYGDALLALREGGRGPEVTAHLDAAERTARRLGDVALENATSLLRAFHAELTGQSDAEIETALAPARRAPPEVAEGLSRHWPALADFVGRRLTA